MSAAASRAGTGEAAPPGSPGRTGTPRAAGLGGQGAAAAADREQDVRERVSELESGLGDPAEPRNPTGFAAFLEADGRGGQLARAERLLEDLGLGAEFVPRGLGGRLAGQDTLARVLRPVFRRDAALGLGQGLTSYLAAAVVWAAGSGRQQRETAGLLLGGGRMAYAYPQPAPGNVFLQNGLIAEREGAARLLSGRKDAMNNAGRARSLVLFAGDPSGAGRPGEEAGCSAYLAPGPADPAAPRGMTLLPRRYTGGLRGCTVQGVEFSRYRLTAEQRIGMEGAGESVLACAFPVVRSTGPSMTIGCADTALRTAAAFALSERRRARGRVPSRTGRAGRGLANAFADLLACDCLALTAARAVHLLPRESGVLGAAVKYLVPTVLGETVYELSGVLGGASYATHGPYGVFRKMARDLPLTGLGAAGAAASRAEIASHLMRLPRLQAPRGRLGGAGADRLFLPHDPVLPPWRPSEALEPPGGDTVLAALDDTAGLLRPGGDGEFTGVLGEQAAALGAELARLRVECEALAGMPPSGRSPARRWALADRYALLVTGAACLEVHAAAARRGGNSGTGGFGSGGFLAGPEWVLLALARVLDRLGAPGCPPPPAAVDRTAEEVVLRHDRRLSYDLYATRIGR